MYQQFSGFIICLEYLYKQFSLSILFDYSFDFNALIFSAK